MKTAIKLTAIAVITVLVALACTPEVELTPRDYSDINESKNAGYTASPGTAFFPSFNPTTFNYYASTDTVPESNKEVTLTFPIINTTGTTIIADVLKAGDVNAALHEFLSFGKYSNPGTTPDAGTPASVYNPSVLGDPVTYSFVRREGTNRIVIKVDVPNIDYIYYKIDASKFKVGGHALDADGDGKVDIYDDRYVQIQINGFTTGNTIVANGSYTAFFTSPVPSNFTINLTNVPGGGFANTTAKPFYWVIYTNNTSGANYAHIRAIINDIVPKIEIQKYDIATNTWVKEGDAASFIGGSDGLGGSGIANWTYDFIYGSIANPADLGIYRIVAKDIAGLKTSANYGASSYPAKIRIYGATILENTYYTNPVAYYNSDVRQTWETGNPISAVRTTHDSNRQNVVLHIFFNSIYDSKAAPVGNVWLDPMSLEDFNKNFKLVYRGDNTALPADTNLNQIKFGLGTTANDVTEIKVTNVAYSVNKHFDASLTDGQTNCITVTLDPSYRITENQNRAISVLLNTGFKYKGGHVTFGRYNNLTATSYSNSYFWRSYGQVPNLYL